MLHQRTPRHSGRRLMRVGRQPAHHLARRPRAPAGGPPHPRDRRREKKKLGGLMRESTTLHHRAPHNTGRRLMRVGMKPPHHLARRPPVPPHSRGRREERWLMRAGTRPQHHRAHHHSTSAGRPPSRWRSETTSQRPAQTPVQASPPVQGARPAGRERAPRAGAGAAGRLPGRTGWQLSGMTRRTASGPPEDWRSAGGCLARWGGQDGSILRFTGDAR